MIAIPLPGKKKLEQKQKTQTITVKTEIKDEEPVIDTSQPNRLNFKEMLMSRMSGKMTTEVKSTTSNIEKNPITGKVKIELPEGTKDSERLDINKMIEAANKEKEKLLNSTSADQPTAPAQVVTNTAGNIPKPPMIALSIPGKKKVNKIKEEPKQEINKEEPKEVKKEELS